MNALTFQVIREGLGFTRDSLAAEFKIRERTVRQWELGQTAIPEWAAGTLRDMADNFVAQTEAASDASKLVIKAGDRRLRAEAWAAIQLNPDIQLEEAS